MKSSHIFAAIPTYCNYHLHASGLFSLPAHNHVYVDQNNANFCSFMLIIFN